MSVEQLLSRYERYVRLPWQPVLAGPHRVWFAIYKREDERRLRARLGAFEEATCRAGHAWSHYDLTNSFPRWLAAQEYREAYFDAPEVMQMALEEYAQVVVGEVREGLSQSGDENSVFALSGLGSLFGLMRAARLIETVAPHIGGRLLVFFPGKRDGSNYRLLDARDGWNYLAIPITAEEG